MIFLFRMLVNTVNPNGKEYFMRMLGVLISVCITVVTCWHRFSLLVHFILGKVKD